MSKLLKAGDQLGLKCPRWGDLIEFIVKILHYDKPRMLIMENVPNLMRHEGGETWRGIRAKLLETGFSVSEAKLSPDMFGVPQTRERAFIVGRRGGLGNFEWPVAGPANDLNIRTVLDKEPKGARYLEPHFIAYLAAWQELIEGSPRDGTTSDMACLGNGIRGKLPVRGLHALRSRVSRNGKVFWSFG